MCVTNSREFGAALRKQRTVADMSLPELAIKAQLPKSLLSTLENGKGNPSLATLHKLAKALNVEITIQ